MEQHVIFISYSRHDKEVVFPFVEQINKALNVECWIDLEGIESGEQFENVIIKAIDECKVVLFMLSDSSLKSDWTKREVYYAEGEGKRIVPVLVKGDKLRGWFKFHFGNIDFIDIRSEEHREKLIRNLKTWLAQQIWKKCQGFVSDEQKLDSFCEERKFVRFVQNDKFGFKDNQTGKIVIDCKWAYARGFQEGLAFVKNEQGKHGFIDNRGTLVIPCIWKEASNFCEGFAVVKGDNDLYGFIDKNGTIVIQCEWQSALPFKEDLACVCDNKGKYGFIDKTGKSVIACIFEDAKEFQDGLAHVKFQGIDGFIDKTGKMVKSY